jgi:hypothetical protein
MPHRAAGLTKWCVSLLLREPVDNATPDSNHYFVT